MCFNCFLIFLLSIENVTVYNAGMMRISSHNEYAFVYKCLYISRGVVHMRVC